MNSDKYLLCRIYREVGITDFSIGAVDHIPGISAEVLKRMQSSGFLRKTGTIYPSEEPKYQISNWYQAICSIETGVSVPEAPV